MLQVLTDLRAGSHAVCLQARLQSPRPACPLPSLLPGFPLTAQHPLWASHSISFDLCHRTAANGICSNQAGHSTCSLPGLHTPAPPPPPQNLRSGVKGEP